MPLRSKLPQSLYAPAGNLDVTVRGWQSRSRCSTVIVCVWFVLFLQALERVAINYLHLGRQIGHSPVGVFFFFFFFFWMFPPTPNNSTFVGTQSSQLHVPPT